MENKQIFYSEFWAALPSFIKQILNLICLINKNVEIHISIF